MGIQHIENLDAETFIDFVRHLDDCVITEKLDGTNIIVGRDLEGNWYISREGKGNSTRYKFPNQFSHDNPATHGYRLILRALIDGHHRTRDRMQTLFQPGQAVVCELLYGRQPNAIVYGENHLVFLHPVEDADVTFTDSEWEAIQSADMHFLQLESFNVTFDNNHKPVIVPWSENLRVNGVPQIDSSLFAPSIQPIRAIQKYDRWLDSGTVGSNLKNRELLKLNLNTLPLDERPPAKSARETASARSTEFKMEIKQYMVDRLATMKPMLRSKKVHMVPAEDFGIEGVVATNPQTGITVKIVNKKLFTAINAFNHEIRNKIRRTSYGSIPDDMLSGIEFKVENVSFYDDMLSTIARIHKLPRLDRYMSIKPALRSYIDTGEISNTVANIAKAWGGDQVHIRSSIQVRGMICAIIQARLSNLRYGRDRFVNHSPNYFLHLGDSDGSDVLWDGSDDDSILGYSPSVYHRTLLMFAEVETEMENLFRDIRFSPSLEHTIYCLFQKQLNDIH